MNVAAHAHAGRSTASVPSLANGPVHLPPEPSLDATDRPLSAPASVPTDDYVMVPAPTASTPAASRNGSSQQHEASHTELQSQLNGAVGHHAPGPSSSSSSHAGPATTNGPQTATNVSAEDHPPNGFEEDDMERFERLLTQVSRLAWPCCAP